jgi:hypothetical protein
VVSAAEPTQPLICFLDRSHYFFFQVAPLYDKHIGRLHVDENRILLWALFSAFIYLLNH